MPTETEFLALKSRVSELEDRLQFLYHRLNLDGADPNADPAHSPRIQDALRRGDKVEAVRIYRELTGARLADAKRAIDEIEAGLAR